MDPIQLESVLGALGSLNWIGRLEERSGDAGGRYVLLVNPDSTALAPLVGKLLLASSPQTAFLSKKGLLPSSNLRSAL